MKIQFAEKTNRDDLTCHQVTIDGKILAEIHPLEPEDAIIGRDLVDGNDIIRFIKLGYEAGKNGQVLEEENVEWNDE